VFVCCECCVLPGRGLCDGLITRPEESYRLWRVVVWSRNLDNEEAKARNWAVKDTTQWVVTPGKQKKQNCPVNPTSFSFLGLDLFTSKFCNSRLFTDNLSPVFATTRWCSVSQSASLKDCTSRINECQLISTNI